MKCTTTVTSIIMLWQLIVLSEEVTSIGGSKLNKWFRKYDLSCSYCRKSYFRTRVRPTPTTNSTTLISIDTENFKCELDKRFLSISIDMIELKRKFRCLPLFSHKINKLAKLLSPAYLRIGGTPQDFLTFVEEENNYVFRQDHSRTEHFYNCTPNFENWRVMKPFNTSQDLLNAIFSFAKRNNLNLIFGLNALLRHKNSSWDDTNARKIMNFAEKNKFKIDWELGNEPHRFKRFGVELTSLQVAEDFRKLKTITKPANIFGPDTTQPTYKKLKFMQSFVSSNPSVDAITYHQYWMPESKSTLNAYLDPTFISKLSEQMGWMVNITANTTTPLWLGETGSSSGGGAHNLSDTYAAGFLYLAKLGVASTNCHKVVIRQSFYGGYYGMLDAITKDPLPDYWTSLLFKKLVGLKSLNMKIVNDPYFKTYAYCTKHNSNDIVLVVINFRKKNSVKLFIDRFKDRPIRQYILTAHKGDLRSKVIELNGRPLHLSKNNRLPSLQGKLVKQPIRIPSTSYGFLVVKNIRFSLCSN